MSWSDDMRCLYCDGKLALYRKITNGQFCSAAHRKAYWQEQERLAVERLHQTHDSLRAYRPAEGIEAILGKPAHSPLAPNRFYLADQYSDEETQPSTEEVARSASNTGSVKIVGFLAGPRPDPCAGEQTLSAEPLGCVSWSTNGLSIPACAFEHTERALDSADCVGIPLFEPRVFAWAAPSADGMQEPVGFVTRLIGQVRFVAVPETEEFDPQYIERMLAPEPEVVEPEPVEEPPFPCAESLLALPRIGGTACELVPRAAVLEPFQTAWNVEKTRLDARMTTPSVVAATGLQRLTVGEPADIRDVGVRTMEAHSVDPKEGMGEPWTGIAIAVLEPALRLAPASRYPITTHAGPYLAPESEVAEPTSVKFLDLCTDTIDPRNVLNPESLELSLSLAPGLRYAVQLQPGTTGPIAETQPVATSAALQIVPLPEGIGAASCAPVNGKVLPLEFHGTPKMPETARPVATGVLHVYPSNQPMQPVAKWEPLDGEATPPPKKGLLAGITKSLAGEEGKHVWSHAVDFWQHAPRDLKLLAVAIPILLGLALHPSLPKVRVAAPVATGGIENSITQSLRAQLLNVRQTVAQRAAVSLNEDFRTGLEEWQTRGDLSTAWSFDSNGFVRPTTLALYRPSIGLTDYEMEFLGLIDKKALSWVVRAADFDNYYVVKIVVLKPGPLPTIGITRYAVINGKAQNRVDTVAPINARPDTLYRVSLNVRDDTYLLALQGKVVDTWSEPRLKRGGIGFFSPHGEESRLRWVQITHQYDMLGRLCAYLAPYNIPTTNGSW